jgi:high affinity Mn2+ porin
LQHIPAFAVNARALARPLQRPAALLTTLAWLASAIAAYAQSEPAPAGDTPDEAYSLHGQITVVDQYHPGFSAPYGGVNSLNPGSRGNETVAATFFAGFRLWDGGQLYADPDIDQGFGLSDTFGIAGFPSGEAYKVGSSHPYVRLHQLFVRQVIGLGGAQQAVAPDANQLGMTQSEDNIVITAGKFAVTSVFDTNAYAHDPSSDFLNWAIIDGGAFDYAADAWGYTYGSSVEWTQSWWTLRSGFFALSRVPNGEALTTEFTQYEVLGEAEARLSVFGEDGKFKFLGFLNEARMGSYNDALRLAELTGATPSTALVRQFKSRPGFELNIEQPIADDLGAFLRASFNNGDEEAYEFTDIDQSVSGGLALKGSTWGRGDDTVGAAVVVDGISKAAQVYFAAGGLGTLIGDGRLTHYETENILETYYSAQVTGWMAATLDYQFIDNPAYNADRGPVSVFGVRLHAAF